MHTFELAYTVVLCLSVLYFAHRADWVWGKLSQVSGSRSVSADLSFLRRRKRLRRLERRETQLLQ